MLTKTAAHWLRVPQGAVLESQEQLAYLPELTMKQESAEREYPAATPSRAPSFWIGNWNSISAQSRVGMARAVSSGLWSDGFAATEASSDCIGGKCKDDSLAGCFLSPDGSPEAMWTLSARSAHSSFGIERAVSSVLGDTGSRAGGASATSSGDSGADKEDGVEIDSGPGMTATGDSGTMGSGTRIKLSVSFSPDSSVAGRVSAFQCEACFSDSTTGDGGIVAIHSSGLAAKSSAFPGSTFSDACEAASCKSESTFPQLWAVAGLLVQIFSHQFERLNRLDYFRFGLHSAGLGFLIRLPCAHGKAG